MSKPNDAEKLAFAATPEAKTIEAEFRAAYADPNTSPTQNAERLKEALKPFADAVLETYCRHKLAGAGTIQKVRNLDLTKTREVRPAPMSAGS